MSLIKWQHCTLIEPNHIRRAKQLKIGELRQNLKVHIEIYYSKHHVFFPNHSRLHQYGTYIRLYSK